MEIYFCWITVLLPQAQDDIITGMAKKGYMVGPTSKDGQVVYSVGDNPAGSVVAISVYKHINGLTAQSVYDDLVQILDSTNGYFYSVIVTAAAEATWVGSNFQLPVRKEVPIPPPPAPDKNLN